MMERKKQKSDSLQKVLTMDSDVEHSDCIPRSIPGVETSFEAVDPVLKEDNVFESTIRNETIAVVKGAPVAGWWRIDKFY